MSFRKIRSRKHRKFAYDDFPRGKRKTPQAETCGVSTAILLAETEAAKSGPKPIQSNPNIVQ
ncbi:hypothetical protein C7399_11889 [Paraburkholderia tropica]|uniref:Transposase n=1 Tax=Paraburkholderia tropica TaxID=92647 RepID=A0ABX5MJV6_9BURK|nr:hypothetical protein C7400_11791 [Paraburkholderia tropica]PZW76464.1 hypothetical protein C7399_11889 [Paraburkholderia tropica]